MKKILMSAAVLAMALASCQNEEIVSQADGKVSVKAVMGIESRTTVGEDGTVTWSKGDKMLVYGGKTQGVLTLEGQGGNDTGTFTGFVQGAVAELTTALYPAEMADVNGNITLSQITYPNSNSPMVATWGETLNFSHLAGLVRVSVTGLTETTNTLSLTGAGIAGTATLANGELTGFSKAKETITVKGIPAGDHVIDVPVFASETLTDATLSISINGGAAKEISTSLKIGAAQCLYFTYGANGLETTDTYTGWYDKEKTEFTLRTAEDLKGLAALVNGTTDKGKDTFEGKTIILNADVDLEGVNWIPIGDYTIGTFKGTFDGNNHVISNLDCIREGVTGVGLFGKLQGTVQNLSLENVEILGSKYAGAVAGYVNYGNVINCHVLGGEFVNVPRYQGADDKTVGAVVGALFGGKLADCSVENVIVRSHTAVGGIVGRMQYGGEMTNNTIKNSIVIQDNTVASNEKDPKYGDIIGQFSSGTMTDNTAENVEVIFGVTSPFQENPNIYVKNNEYYVYTAEDLKALMEKKITGYTVNLVSDITLTKDWTPISRPYNISKDFPIIFDGKGHTITGLTINAADKKDQGLFDKVAGTIKNLNFKDVVGTAKGRMGIIAGQFTGTIENCKAVGVDLSVSEDRVGGWVGLSYGSTIKSCEISITNISATEGHAGGLVGTIAGGISDNYIANTIVGIIDGNGKGSGALFGGLGDEKSTFTAESNVQTSVELK